MIGKWLQRQAPLVHVKSYSQKWQEDSPWPKRKKELFHVDAVTFIFLQEEEG